MAGNKFQDFIKRHSGGTTTSSSFSPYQRPSTQELYNGYAREAEEEENKFQKFIKNHGSGAQQIPQGVMGYRQMQENTFRMQAEQAKAQREYRAELLPELEKKKTGELAPTSVQEAQARIAELEADVQKMLNTYGSSYYDGSDLSPSAHDNMVRTAQSRAAGLKSVMEQETNSYLDATATEEDPRTRGMAKGTLRTIQNSDAQKAAAEIMDATGWDLDTLNSYLADAKSVGQFEYDKENGGTFLTPTEELQYARASIEALSDGERAVMAQIKKGQDQNFSDNARYTGTGNAAAAVNWLTGKDEGMFSGNTTIKDAQKVLREEYGWDDEKIEQYTLMSERLSNAEGTEEYNEAFAISQDDSTSEKFGKSAANTAWNLFNAPFEGTLGVLSNFKDKPDGFGRDTNTWTNLRQNSSEEAARQVVDNAITEAHPIGQQAYQIGLSTAEAAELALMGGSLGGGAAAKGATLVPFATSAYNTGYNDARERGASEKDAQMYGIASGAAEAGTELISLDHLWGMAKGTKVGRDLVVSWLAQAGIEASEEAASDLLNRYSDYMILGDDGQNAMTLAIDAYIENGYSEEEAVQQAHKDFWKQVGLDALGGFVSGGVLGGGGFVAGHMNAAQNKQRAAAIQDYHKDADIDTSTEYGYERKQAADRYASNPTQYMADMIDDSTAEGKARKAEMERLASQEAQGQRLSASDRNYIEESLYVAENAAQQSEEAMSAREKYQQYANEMAAVPAEYRTASTSITEDQARADLGKAAATGNVEALGEAYSKMKNAKSADLRSKADNIYSEYYGMAESHGVTRQQLEAFKVSPQEAYSAGLKGENRGTMGALSMKAAEAFRAGQQAYHTNKNTTVVESKSNLQKANALTKGGKNVVLTGVFSSDGNVITQDGQQVSVNNLNLGDSAVQKAYGYADTQPSVMAKNAYISNIKDGTNLESYNIAFGSVFRAGRVGMDYDRMIQNGKYNLYAQVLGEDTVRAMYDAGVAQTQMEKAQEATASVNAAFQIKKGSGVFEDARVDKSDNMNTEVFRIIANVSGLNIRLVDDKGALGKEGANAYFDPKSSTIVVGSHATAQAFHEVLGEFTKYYNSADYAVIKKAAMNGAAEILGADLFDSTTKSYSAAYGKAGLKNTDDEMSDEMTNDYVVAILSTDKGRQVFAKYLAENCSKQQANSIKDKIANLYKSIVRSIKNIMSRSKLMPYQQRLLENGYKRLEQDADLFIKAFAKAVENYRSMEDGATVTGEKAFSVTVDTTGRTLSEQQQEFFAGSKIRNKDGALKVMHHGSIAYGFSVFDIKKAKSAGAYGRGFYFSDSDSHAGQYGKTYDVYLNIVNPVAEGTHDITKAQLRAFIDEIANDDDYGIENYGYGATPASVTADVWGKDDFAMLQDINATCVGDFAEAVKIFNRVNGTTYDGIVAPTETIAFYSNQIKEVTNEKPTSDPDIRFSLKVDPEDYKAMSKDIPTTDALEGAAPVEQTKTLIAVHNLGGEQLEGILDLGGLPCPSIAVIKAGMEHSRYGEVSIMFKKEAIDPEFSRNNHVYGGDAWTVCFPSIEYKLSDKVLDKVRKMIADLPVEAQKLGYAALDEDNASDKMNSRRGDVVDAFRDIPQLQFAFMTAEDGLGETILEYPMKTKQLSSVAENEAIAMLSEKLPEGILDEGWNSVSYKDYADTVSKLANEASYAAFLKKREGSGKPVSEKLAELYKNKFNDIPRHQFDNLMKAVEEYRKAGYQFPKEFDHYGFKDALAEMAEENADTYAAWLRKTFDGLVEKKGIRNNRDVFDNRGNRRSWERLHDEATLANITAVMKADGEKGAAGFFSVSSFQALATRDFKSIDDIHAHEGQLYLMDEAEREALQDEHNSRFSAICNEIMDKGERNSFIALDNAAECIAEAVQKHKDAKGIQAYLKRYRQLDVKPDTGKKIVELMEDIASMPTEYFEAKPMRSVWFDEIAKVVIPSTTDQKVIERLEGANIPYEVYEAGNEDARTRVLAETENARFSINVDDSDYSYETLKKKENIRLNTVEELGLKAFEYSADLKTADVLKTARENIAAYNRKTGRGNYNNRLYNADLGRYVEIGRDGLKHGFAKMSEEHANAVVALPAYFENAIVFNEAAGARKEADKAYVLFGAYKDGNDAKIVRIVLNHYENGLQISELNESVYAIGAKKEKVAAHLAAPIRSKNSFRSTFSDLTITQLMYAVKENYPNELSKDVASHLEYKRGKSDIEGLRYSLDVDDTFWDIFGGEELAESASILEEGMEALKHQKVDTAKVRSVAHKIRKEFGSTISLDTLTGNLEKVFAYMQIEDHVNYNDMMRVLDEVATPVIDQATTLEGKEMYDAFVDALKGYSIRLTEAQKQEVISVFGSYGEFRRMMMPININDKGTADLEMLWNEIAEASGGVLDADTVEGDMPTALYDALSSLRPSPVNNYGGNREAVSKDLAMRIVEEYLATQSDAKAKAAAEKMRKKNAQYRANLRNNYEKKLKEARADIRNKYYNRGAQMRERNEEKIAKIRAKNRQTATNARRKRLANHEKEMISKQASALMKWLESPTEKHHVPREMVEPVVEFLYALDFVEPDVKQDKDGKWYVRVFNHSVIGADGSRSMVFDTLTANTREEALQMFYDAIGSGTGSKAQKSWTEKMRKIEDIFKQVASEKPFDSRDMDDFMETIDPALAEEFADMLQRSGGIARINQLEYEDLHLINKALRGITHAINQGNKAFTQNATIEEMARSTIDKADSKKVSDKQLEIGGRIKKLLNLDMLTPSTYFHIQGKGGDMVYEALRKGFNTEILDIKEAQEFMDGVLKDCKKELKKWTGENAEVHNIPTSAGTIQLTTAQIMSLYATSKRKQAMEHMAGGFRPDEIKSRALLLLKKKTQQGDFHLTQTDIKNITDNLTAEQRAVADKMQQFLAVNCAAWGNKASMQMYGYEKFTDPHYFPIKTVSHTNRKKNESIATETLNGIERSGFTKQIKEGAKNPILIRDIFDVFTDHVSGMAAYHGKAPAIKDANRWFNYRIVTEDDWQQIWKTVQEAVETNSGTGGVNYYTKLMSDINGQSKSQYLGDSKLISNYKAASVGFNLRVVIQQPTAYVRAMNVINPKYLISVNPKKVLREIAKSGNRVKENSPIAWWKSQGHYESAVSQSMRDIIVRDRSFGDKFKDASMWAAGRADDFTWGVLYEAVEKEQRDVTKGMGLTEEQFRQRVNDRFDEMVDKTQVVDSTLHRSQFMRSKDKLNVLQSAFMSEPTKTYNMMYEALHTDKKHAARALATYIMTATLTSAAAAVVDMLRYTEDGEEPEEVWWENFVTNWCENIAPWNLIPTVKDIAPYIMSFLTGESTYTSSNRMDLDAAYNMLNAMKEIKKAAEGESNKNFYGVAYSTAQAFSQLTGAPASNVIRELVSLHNFFRPDITKTKTSNPYTLIYDTIKKQGDVDAKVKYAMDNNGNLSDIQSGIASRYKSDYYEAYQNDPEEAQEIADEAKRGLMALDMTEAEADQIIEEWKVKKRTYTEIDAAIESGEGIAEEIKLLQTEKEDEDIVKHIFDEYTSTIEYNRNNHIDSDVEDNVNDALKIIDSSYSYDERKKFYEEKAAKKAADDALKVKKENCENTIYSAIDTGNGLAEAQASINELLNSGISASTIKGDITEKYKAKVVADYRAGKNIHAEQERIIQMKVYIDTVSGFTGADDYRAHEEKEFKKWFKENQ